MDWLLPYKLWRALQQEPDDLSRYRQRGYELREEPHVKDAGVFWNYLIGQTIHDEVISGNFDLLAASPLGALRTMWVFGVGAMHYKRLRVGWVERTMVPVLWIASLIVVSVLFPPIAIIVIVGFGIPLWREYDILLGTLIGMIAPTYSKVTSDFITLSILFHLAILGLILAAGIIIHLLLIAVFSLAPVLSFFVALALVALLCHSIIVGLWRLLLYRTNATPEDVRFVLGD